MTEVKINKSNQSMTMTDPVLEIDLLYYFNVLK